MSPSRPIREGLPLLLLALLVALAPSCGGGGGGGGGAPPPVPQPLTITTSAMPEGTLGQNYSQGLQATGGRTPYTWALATGSNPLPPGISLVNSAFLSGTPTAAGDFSFTVEVRDAAGATASRQVSLRVATPVNVAAFSLGILTTGESVSLTLAADGGTPPYSWRVSTGSLPPGLALSTSGVISGTPTTPGGYSFWVEARDAANRTATRESGASVYARLTIVTASLANGRRGLNYYSPLEVTGGEMPYSWSLGAGSGPIPTGLTFGYNFISGVPTVAGTFSFTLQVRDYHNRTASQTFTMNIADGPMLTTTALPYAFSGEPYEFQLAADGGTPPYSWAPQPGYSLPLDITLSSTGLVSGSFRGHGSAGVYVTITDSAGLSSPGRAVANIYRRLSITSGPLPDGNVGIYYTTGIQIVNDAGGTITIVQGSLPPGLGMGPWGYISGVPTVPGNHQFTVQVNDTIGQSAQADISILIKNNVIITTSYLPIGVVTVPYDRGISSVGGVLPLTWSVASGSPPPGLTLDPVTGHIFGTPIAEGDYSFVVQAADSSSPPQVGTATMFISVRPTLRIISSTLNDAVQGNHYAAYIPAEGGQPPPYSVRLAAGALPTGLILGTQSSSDGHIQLWGTPTAVETAQFTIEVSDLGNPPQTASESFSLRVNPRLMLPTGSLPETLEGRAFSWTFTATGGVAPFTWSVGALPQGMSLDPATGVFSGVPGEEWTTGVAITVRDSSNPPQVAQQFYSWHVVGILRISTTSLPAVRVGAPIRIYPSVTGGACCTYSWSMAGGSLPPGVSMVDPLTGEMRGTPSTSGTFTFTLHVSDGSTGQFAQTAQKQLQLVVGSTLGRNDSIATATPISNGYYGELSLSPLADPPGGTLNMDVDYYALTAKAGAVVVVESHAACTDSGCIAVSPIDTVLEALDASGSRLTSCNLAGYETGPFPSPCVNDDAFPYSLDSQLILQVPGAPGTTVTVFIRVLDWSGSARPDFQYELKIKGVS